MVKKTLNFSSFLAWIVGILVSLAVGSGMIQRVLIVPGLTFANSIVTVVAGWIVVIGALISIISTVFGK